eukprot:XP_014767659.1 PREDICTED: coiled-coil domain-containing protein 108-like isoform X2 [Octopus bimaculoides]
MPVALIRSHQIKKLGDCIVKQPLPSFPKIKYTIKKCGAEISSPIEWKKWIPGMEYTKCIVIKNLLMKIQKFTYELPETKFFLTPYPKTISLSTGTSFYLPVTFHPLEEREYKDKIKFSSNEGTFFVELMGLLPKQEIKLTKSVILPVCSVFSQTTTQVKLKNVGEVPVEVRWSATEPFEVQCSEDILAPEQSHEVTIIFKPKAARKYEGELVCRYGTELKKWKILKAVAQGKYPHLKISATGLGLCYEESPEGTQANIDFGVIPIGQTVKKYITVENLSHANVAFKIEFLKSPSKTSCTNVFLLPEKNGVILPMSNFNIPIHFTPDIVNSPIIEYFCVVPHGHISGNVIKCVGYSEGPKVHFKYGHINFQIVNLGSKASKNCSIVNDSQVTITYKEPIFLDVLGTCHSGQVKPYFLAYKHIRSYQYKVRQGFGAYPPDQLNELVERHVTEIDASGKITAPQYPLAETKDPMEMFFNSNPKTEEYTAKATGSVITLDTYEVNFGRHLGLNDTVEKEIAITNHSLGKVVTQWTKGSSCAFTVIPLSIEIPSNKSATVKIIFTPNQPHLFYESELECFVYFKCLRSYHIAKDNTMCPPFCVTVNCSGNTYPVQHQMFVPQYTLQDSAVIRFPSVDMQSSGYKTLIICNNGSSPLLYQFDKDPNGILRVRPSRGLITKGHQIFILRFSPQEIKKYHEEIKMCFNNCPKFYRLEKASNPVMDQYPVQQVLTVHGWCEEPAVQLDNDKKVYLKPTCIGTKSEALYSFKNVTSKVLCYDWYWQNADNEFIEVCSKSGKVLANESLCNRFIFSPTVVGKKTFLLNLFIWPAECPRTKDITTCYEIKVVGFGTIGELAIEPIYTNFGDVIVGCTADKDILLYNPKNCDTHCKLLLKQTMDGIDLPFEKCTAIQLSEQELVMAAKSKQILTIVVVPPAHGTFQFTISYKLILNEDVVKDPSAIEYKHLCHLLMTGVYPLVTVTDIQGRQSARGIRKRRLWSSFSIDCFNSYLHSDPSYRELNFSAENQKTTDKFPNFETEAIVDFDFAAAALGSPSSEFIIKFQNDGIIPAEWDFLFPDDLTMELEPWADTGPANDEESCLLKILEENIFTVTPQKSVVQPGESIDVRLSYNHTHLGTYRLPVLFKMKYGREILINFVGVTVEVNMPYIHFNSLQHTFSPMAIGTEFQPKQIYELYNGGAVTVKYKVDTHPLKLLNALNYNYPIFVCNNPTGEIEPGGTAIVEWIFSPLESKTYSVDIPIYLEEGETVLVNFVGLGYDANRMGNAMPYSTVCDVSTPDKQLIKLPDQFVFLSLQKIAFGNIPLFSMSRRILFANNYSSERNATLEWHLNNEANEELITVIPRKYLLRPNESVLFQVIFLDRSSPAFYEIQLLCKITDETEVRRYKLELKQWTLEHERQQNEFKITEDNLDMYTPDLDIDELYVNSKRLKQLLKPLQDFPGDLMAKYRTLPPIGQSRESKHLITKSYKNSETLLWKKPVMPACLELPVSISARTLSPEEYEILHQKRYRSFLINKTHYISSTTPTRVNSKNVKAKKRNLKHHILTKDHDNTKKCLKVEKEITCRILIDILRGLLSDSYFIESLLHMKNEKVYYYQQFVSIPTRRYEHHSQAVATSPYHEDVKIPKRDHVDAEIVRNNEIKDFRDRETPERSPSAVFSRSYSAPLCPELFNFFKLDREFREKQEIQHLVEFNNFVELFLDSCIFGIMDEAMRRKFNITAPSRFIALPRKADTNHEKYNSHGDNHLTEHPNDVSQPVTKSF